MMEQRKSNGEAKETEKRKMEHKPAVSYKPKFTQTHFLARLEAVAFFCCNVLNFKNHFTFLYLCLRFNPLPDSPILGSPSSAADKDMITKIWTNGDTIFCLSRKHCGKRRNCSL